MGTLIQRHTDAVNVLAEAATKVTEIEAALDVSPSWESDDVLYERLGLAEDALKSARFALEEVAHDIVSLFTGDSDADMAIVLTVGDEQVSV